MLNKVTNALFHMMPSGMLLIAIGRWPYGYYMLLRVVVPAASTVARRLYLSAHKQVHDLDRSIFGCRDRV